MLTLLKERGSQIALKSDLDRLKYRSVANGDVRNRLPPAKT
ncbi:hypothetical protein [Aestuariicoccus sp. MJ-SS9]|nr:hypothetical protein [Aestuariicoccus sp. MJ-SS9]MDU8914185.1 hypothetical protein [Aestuariicoccus sp. MJ-SS9]